MPDDATLTDVERIALLGIIARREAAMASVNADESILARAIEARLGLPVGAIGAGGTHRVEDAGNGVVRVVATLVAEHVD